jgi:hypothetical protein
MVKMVNSVASVGEEVGVTGVAPLVILYTDLHDGVLPVLETCTRNGDEHQGN